MYYNYDGTPNFNRLNRETRDFNNRKELKTMSFEQWLEQNDEIVSDTTSQLLDELYAQYVYEENKTLSDCIFVTEEALAYVDGWFN